MLILKKEAVKSCQLQINDRVVSGIKYLNFAFLKGQRYDKQNDAIKRAREFLDNGKFCIILKESDAYSLWHVAPKNFEVLSDSEPRQETGLDPQFLAHCQKELARYIGPMAKLICEETLKNASSSITRQEYLQALILQIPDQKQAIQFLKTVKNNW